MNRKPGRPNRLSSPPTSWSGVAQWYDGLVGEAGSEYHQHVILPGVLRMLNLRPGEAVIDVACGQGVLCRALHEKGAKVTGVDAAAELVEIARKRSDAAIQYHIGDARELSFLPEAKFAAATCVLSIQNIHPLAPVFESIARLLTPGGRLVIVMMHPCFRGPKQTSWGWDKDVQYRRVDRYLVPRKEPIVTHPGKDPGKYTWTFHYPLQAYVKAMRPAGLAVDWLEEWPSHKTSTSGPRAPAENTARQEIPMFMAIRAIRTAL